MPNFRVDRPFHLRLDDPAKPLRFFDRGAHALSADDPDDAAAMAHFYFKAMAVKLVSGEKSAQPTAPRVDPSNAAEIAAGAEATRASTEAVEAQARGAAQAKADQERAEQEKASAAAKAVAEAAKIVAERGRR